MKYRAQVTLPVVALLTQVLNLQLCAQYSIESGTANDLYATHCATCHGANLEGGSASSLLDDVWRVGPSIDEMTATIRDGLPNTAMQPWKKILSEEQIGALGIFLAEQRIVIDRAKLAEQYSPKGNVYESQLHSFRLEKVAQGSGVLWGFDFLPDGSIIASQRAGALWHFREDGVTRITRGLPEIFHCGGESGLFDVKAHPDYQENGWLYLSYSGPATDKKGTGMTAIDRGRIQNGRWTDNQPIFRAPLLDYTDVPHNWGSRIAFKDGYIYFSIGDRAYYPGGQDLRIARGKIHRLKDDGTIPEDNPFVGTPGLCHSIWTWGHRNPQGLTVNPANGVLWSSEHGPRGGDEVNRITRGGNFGWPIATHGMHYFGELFTTNTELEGTISPQHHWTPSIGVGGISFYTGDKFPKWTGDLFVCGMGIKSLYRFSVENGAVNGMEIVMTHPWRIRHVVDGPDGSLYISSTSTLPGQGGIYKLVPVNDFLRTLSASEERH